ncbi:MAG: hypothetical protein LQ347_003982 [Umbilicaria vellea]|nr:MAG: hypothetical protein LQ347_003982 [Umbilicaria vellea]
MASTDRDVPDDSVPAGEVLPAKELLRSSQPPSGKVKKHLSDLCNDVWNYILDYLSGPHWLYRVMRLSKRFHQLALPRLYKSMSFHLDFPHQRLMVALFDTHNPGLQDRDDLAHIDTLVLNLGCYCHEARDYRDAVIPCSLATKSFFALFAVIPLALTKLELRDADLRETTPAILSALNLAILKDLGLQRCQGADIFLTSLSRSKHPPRLHSLRVNHVMPTGEDTIIAAIDDFLVCTPSCLRTLSIILRGYLILPKASSIIHHGFTLEHLFLDVRAYTNRTYDDCDKAARYRGPEFSTFISNLPHLTQLAMAFPKVIADASYAYAIEQNDEFNTQLDGVLELPSLVTLNITTYPFPIGTPSSHDDPSFHFSFQGSVYPAAHHALLTHLANEVLRRSRDYHYDHHNRESPLRTVAFGIAEKGHKRTALIRVKELRPAYFTRSDVWEWRKAVREDMKTVALRLLHVEGQEVDVLMERVDEDLGMEEMMEWDGWWVEEGTA